MSWYDRHMDVMDVKWEKSGGKDQDSLMPFVQDSNVIALVIFTIFLATFVNIMMSFLLPRKGTYPESYPLQVNQTIPQAYTKPVNTYITHRSLNYCIEHFSSLG